MRITDVRVLMDLTNPIGELEKIISYVVGQQPPENHVFLLETLRKSIDEGVDRIKKDHDLAQKEHVAIESP